MIAENLEVQESQLKALTENPQKKKLILKIIIQALYSLGLEKSAAELQKQSQVTYLSPEIKEMRQQLIKENYETVKNMLRDRKIQIEEIYQILYQLQYFKLVREEKVEEALQLLKTSNFQENKKNKLAEELMLGEGKVPEQQLLKKYQTIVEKCLKKDIEENSLQKILKEYIILEKKGLTKILPGLSILQENIPLEVLPPKNKIFKKKVKSQALFIKFDRKGEKAIIICEGKKSKILYSCHVVRDQIEIISEKQLTIEEDIENVCWDFENKIALSTYFRIIIISGQLEVLFEKSLRKESNKSCRILCSEWNPVNKFLYVGGSFESIKILNNNLDEIMVIQPFIGIRNFCFNEEGTILFSISATTGLLLVYNIFSEREESRLESNQLFMSLKVKGKKLVTTTQKYVSIYNIEKRNKSSVLVENIRFNSPDNSGGIVLEAGFFRKWIICLGEKVFKGYLIDGKKSKEIAWDNEGSNAFDLNENILISGSNQLKLWNNASMIQQQEQMLEAESEDEEELEESEMISEEQEDLDQDDEDDDDDLNEDNA